MLEIFTTVSSKKQCQYMASILVKQKLAACVSFWPVSSVYRWKGKVRTVKEWMLCIKTSKKLGKKCETKLRELHPYALPMITVEKMKVDKRVEQWVNE